MKPLHFLLSLILTLLTLTSKAQSNDASIFPISDQEVILIQWNTSSYKTTIESKNKNGHSNWQNSFPNQEENIIQNVHRLKDGSYLLTGTSFSEQTQYDYWIIKLDNQGKVLWNKNAGSKQDELFVKSWVNKDGNIYLTGNQTNAKDNNWNVFILCIDSYGNKLWEQSYGTENDDIFNDAITTSDLGIAIIYTNFQEKTVEQKEALHLMKLNQKGEIDWTYQVSLPNTSLMQATLKEMENSTIEIKANKYTYSTPNKSNQDFSETINNTGKLVTN